jgi:hypothetical protein
VERETGAGRAESGNEVIFEGANCLFGGIAAMDAWWSKLKINVGVVKEGLECRGRFIVKTLETRF